MGLLLLHEQKVNMYTYETLEHFLQTKIDYKKDQKKNYDIRSQERGQNDRGTVALKEEDEID